MPKSKEFVESSSEEESSEEEPKPKKKKAEKVEKKSEKKSEKSSNSQTDKEGNVMYALSRNRFAVVSEFRGKKMVNIREYYEADGDLKPGKKGISLTLEQWHALKDAMPDIDEAIKG